MPESDLKPSPPVPGVGSLTIQISFEQVKHKLMTDNRFGGRSTGDGLREKDGIVSGVTSPAARSMGQALCGRKAKAEGKDLRDESLHWSINSK